MEPRFQQAGQAAEGSPRRPLPPPVPAQRPPPRSAAPHTFPAPLHAPLNVLLLLCPRGKTLTSDTQMCESLNCMRGQSTPLSGKLKNMTSDSLCDCCRPT